MKKKAKPKAKATADKSPSKGGRPSKYRPEFAEMLIEHSKSGLSFEAFAGLISVNQDTIHEWAKRHPEFSEAKKIATSRSLLFWERMGIRGTMGVLPGFNVGSWIFNMKNRFGWTDVRPEKDPDGESPIEKVMKAALKAVNES